MHLRSLKLQPRFGGRIAPSQSVADNTEHSQYHRTRIGQTVRQAEPEAGQEADAQTDETGQTGQETDTNGQQGRSLASSPTVRCDRLRVTHERQGATHSLIQAAVVHAGRCLLKTLLRAHEANCTGQTDQQDHKHDGQQTNKPTDEISGGHVTDNERTGEASCHTLSRSLTLMIPL